MKFIKKLFHTDTGAGPMEKFVTYFVPIFGLFLILWLFSSAWGMWNNDVSDAAHLAPGWSKLVGWVLFFAAIFWAWWNWTDRIPFRVNDLVATLLLGLLLVLSVCFFCGFWIDRELFVGTTT